jgi:hypothetical protein
MTLVPPTQPNGAIVQQFVLVNGTVRWGGLGVTIELTSGLLPNTWCVAPLPFVKQRVVWLWL